MWRICDRLRKSKYAVFNGRQVNGGEDWSEVFFDKYLSQSQLCIVMLSQEYVPRFAIFCSDLRTLTL